MAIVNKIIGVAVGLLVAGAMIPMALEMVSGSSSALTGNGVNASVVTIFTVLLPILAIIGLALYFLPHIRGD